MICGHKNIILEIRNFEISPCTRNDYIAILPQKNERKLNESFKFEN